jgi:hypothetical protein
LSAREIQNKKKIYCVQRIPFSESVADGKFIGASA